MTLTDDHADAPKPRPLSRGTRLGPYEVIELVGAGGMGEVWRAHDTRLGRDVAVKVLPADDRGDSDRLARFEVEARAASALDHPNIVIVHDVGSHEGAPYVVSELLTGQTLRARLGTPLSLRRVVDWGRQIALGLAAAHEKGIVHRDIKPENLFVTSQGVVKILDFGLAKLVERAPTGDVALTQTGAVLGTAGYMSPEQVRGDPIDARSDLFSLGMVLYEMIAGQRPFGGATPPEAMTAILHEEPAPLSAPPALERLVLHCLEKRPEERFQAARDVAFALDGIGEARPAPRARRRRLALLAVPAALVLLAAGWLVGSHHGPGKPQEAPTFQRLSFRRGFLGNAAFTPDGKSVVYSGNWNERGQNQIYTTRIAGPESRPVVVPGEAILMAVSRAGELAVLRDPHYQIDCVAGTLARLPLEGGAPRDVLEDVIGADFVPGGDELMIVRTVAGFDQVELPAGHVVYRTQGSITFARVAPGGDRVAFIEHPDRNDDRGAIAVVDRDGKQARLTDLYASVSGLAWTPRGEVWFTAAEVGADNALRAVTPGRQARLVLAVPGRLDVYAIDGEGRVLLGRSSVRLETYALVPGETHERSLSWFDWSVAHDLSPDGKKVLLVESGHAAGADYRTYLRGIDGSDPILLGKGMGQSLSPDGKWALFAPLARPEVIEVIPTGPGKAWTFPKTSLVERRRPRWLPDGKRAVYMGIEPGQPRRLYVEEPGTAPRPISPPGAYITSERPVSPDGKWVVGKDGEHAWTLYAVDGSEPRKVAGIAAEEQVGQWTADGRLYGYNNEKFPVRVFKVDPATGEREPLREIHPRDPDARALIHLLLTPDARGYVYSTPVWTSDLYLVEGLMGSR